jgi:hypothetical protein
VLVDDRPQARVDDSGRCPKAEPWPRPSSRWKRPSRRELGDLAHARRRRLDVVRERDRVDRHLARGSRSRRVVVQARLPLGASIRPSRSAKSCATSGRIRAHSSSSPSTSAG